MIPFARLGAGIGVTVVVTLGVAASRSPADRMADDATQIDQAPICGVTVTAVSDEEPFLTENATAMARMMRDMEVAPTGDVDRDFVAMMVPHHQGAIDMARAVLRYGRNEQIHRLAQEIIVTQQQEIAAMRLALGEPLPPSSPAPSQIAPRLADRASTPRQRYRQGEP